MLEGLPPNNAAHLLRLVCDESEARAVADLIVESFEPAEAASTAFETEEPWPGGGKAWLVEAYFGFAPDEENLRELVAAAAGAEAAARVYVRPDGKARLGRQCARRPCAGAGQGVFSSTARMIARASKPTTSAIEIEAGLAFGTGHHGTTRGCLLHFDRLLKRRRPARVLDVGCGAGVLAIAAAKVLKRKVWLGDLDPVAVEVANENARLNGVGRACKAIVSRGVENSICAKARLTMSSSPIFWPNRCVCSRPRSSPSPRAMATRSSRACSMPTCPACWPPGARKASRCASASISKAGRACGCRGRRRSSASRSAVRRYLIEISANRRVSQIRLQL